jgi:Protein of unknown function (DUF1579)
MLNTTRAAVLCGCLGLCLAVSPAAAQGPPMPKPGPEHEILKQDVGTWDAVVELLEAGQPASTSKGVETVTLMGGGLWTLTEFKADLMGMPFHGHGQNGFDAAKKKYVSSWVDSMSVGITLGEFTYDAKTKTMKGWLEGPDPTGKPMRMNETVEWKDPDTRIFTMSIPGPDGKDTPNMRISYKRRK